MAKRVMKGDAVLAAGVILRRATALGDRWLLLRDARWQEWGFPKGHAKKGEDIWATALRECAEECGIALLEREGEPLELHYRVRAGWNKVLILFPARTNQETVTLSDEHIAAQWCDAATVQRLLPYPTLCELFATLLARPGP